MSAGMPPAAFALAFVFAHLLALPGLAIALYLYLVGRVAGSGGWLAALFELLFSGVVVLPVVMVCAAVLLVSGLFASLRPWASVALVALDVAVLAVSWVISPPGNAPRWWCGSRPWGLSRWRQRWPGTVFLPRPEFFAIKYVAGCARQQGLTGVFYFIQNHGWSAGQW